ncbi:MAG TPA: ATPase [Micromonosporaceae bacterium]|nr:ATPase [Micromonosporaceae bacterium]
MGKINLTIDLAVTPDRAFEVFTDGMSAWWPREYTWSGPQALAEIGMEGGAGGLCYEIGPHGFRCDWGRILVWDPPRRLVFTWQIGPSREPVPDPERAGEIEVHFSEHGEGCRLDFEHRGFAKYGKGSDEYRAAMQSSKGWPYILEKLREAYSSKT